MRIAVVVQGRFHAFDLVRAMLKRGNDVVVFTNYPRWAVERFGIPGNRVCSFPLHGVLSRAGTWISAKTGWSSESWVHPLFSRWAARNLRRQHWDVIHAWSGVSEEIYGDAGFCKSLKIVMRGSAHISEQAALLAEEQLRAGCAIDHPSEWMVAREQREYALADLIVVLSTFALNSFRVRGIENQRLRMLPLGTETSAFRPTPEVIERRRERICSGAPLRVLYVGGISWRKGLVDLLKIVETAGDRFQFRFVGPVWSEAESAISELNGRIHSGAVRNVEFIAKQPQKELPQQYAWGDVFIFPTVEDGYAVVLAQASAAGLPILTTANCSGPDLIHEGSTGWILPIRDGDAFLSRLRWCDANRQKLAEMVSTAFTEFRTRDWTEVAADFQALCEAELLRRKSASTGPGFTPALDTADVQ